MAPHLRGTYRGMIEKIPYLKDLGITAVELMPIMKFHAEDSTRHKSADRRKTSECLGL